MDIAQLSTAMKQGEIQQQAAVSVLKMGMDTASQQGQALEKMMGAAQAVSDPSLGQRIDVLA